MKNKIPTEYKKCAGVYEIYNIKNNKSYIGSTVSLSRRFSTHKHQLEKNAHGNIILQNSYIKNGKDSFEFRLIEVCEKKDIIKREQFYLDKFNPVYNIKLQAGYSNHSFCPTKEHIEKIRKANLGKPKSKETIEKLRLSHIGKKVSDKTKEKLRIYNLGKKLSEETKNKISNSLKNKKMPDGWYPHTTKLSINVVIKIKILLKTKKIKEVHSKLKHLSVTKSQIAEISAGRTWKNIKI